MNREMWLTIATDELHKMIIDKTDLLPSLKVQVSTGWPRRDKNGKVIGQCFASSCTDDETHTIFISPTLALGTEVLPTLLHELVHAADNCKHGHKGAFRQAWKALGFVGKPTESTPGPELAEQLKALAERLGEYPHSRVTHFNGKKQSTRMLKVQCPSDECGYVVRTTQKWLDLKGAPWCPCGERMKEQN